jgi:hypothetical protein
LKIKAGFKGNASRKSAKIQQGSLKREEKAPSLNTSLALGSRGGRVKTGLKKVY